MQYETKKHDYLTEKVALAQVRETLGIFQQHLDPLFELMIKECKLSHHKRDNGYDRQSMYVLLEVVHNGPGSPVLDIVNIDVFGLVYHPASLEKNLNKIEDAVVSTLDFHFRKLIRLTYETRLREHKKAVSEQHNVWRKIQRILGV